MGLAVHDGAVAFLLGAAHPGDRSVPDDLLLGDLWLDGRKVGSGVSSQPGMYEFSARGELAFLAQWQFRRGEGQLWTAAPSPSRVAEAASAYAWSPEGTQLAYVGPDVLGIRGRPPLRIEGMQAISWAPDGQRLAARTSAAAGGKLFVVDVRGGSPREVALGTTDFAFAPDGALAALGPPPAKGGDRPLLLDGVQVARATAFSFSPDGKKLALLSTEKQPGEAYGDLYELSRERRGQPRLMASRASEWRWSADGQLICLGGYDLRARSGALLVSGRQIAAKVQSFSLHGRRLLYLVQAPGKGDFRIELWAADLATAAPPRKIDEGVYGWDVSPDGARLYYKARCAGGPRSCSLFRADFAGGEPALLAANVAGFDLSRDGTRILLLQPHPGAPRAVDLALVPAAGGEVKKLLEEADPGSRFADGAGKKVAYAIVAAGQGGVYVADVP